MDVTLSFCGQKITKQSSTSIHCLKQFSTTYVKEITIITDLHQNWFKCVKNTLNYIVSNIIFLEGKCFNSSKLQWLLGSVITVVEFHSEACEVQWLFASRWPCSEVFLIPSKMVWGNTLENWHFLIFKLHFWYQTSTKSFRKWFSFLNIWIVEQLLSMTFYHYLWFWSTLFSKNVPNFWRLCLKPFYKISRDPLSMFIGMWKAIEFYMPYYEIPHPSLRYYWAI